MALRSPRSGRRAVLSREVTQIEEPVAVDRVGLEGDLVPVVAVLSGAKYGGST